MNSHPIIVVYLSFGYLLATACWFLPSMRPTIQTLVHEIGLARALVYLFGILPIIWLVLVFKLLVEEFKE
jgi:hypothetical protein